MANHRPAAVQVKAPHLEKSASQKYQVPPERVTRYSPMATFGSTAALPLVPFRRHFWATFVTIVLGLEFTIFPNDRYQCGRRDPTAPTHHDLSCTQWAAYTAGHEIIVHVLELCISGGILVQTGSKVPNQSSIIDQGANVHTKTATDQPSEVTDFSIVNATQGDNEPVPCDPVSIPVVEAELGRGSASTATAASNHHDGPPE